MAGIDEKDWLDLVHQVGCVVCAELGYGFVPCDAHHIREDQGVSKRAADFLTVALCPGHHRPDFPEGFHRLGRRKWEPKYGTELEALAATIKGVLRILRGRA